MDNDDALDMAAKQILLLAKNNFIFWGISIILVFIAKSTYNRALDIIALISLILILIKSIKLSILIKNYFNILYEIYGPHPNEKRNSLIASFFNIVILGLVILLFINRSSSWYIIPLILLSCFIFVMLGVSLGRENKALL